MSEVQLTSDLTGALSQTDLNTQDIQNIVDEFNKFQDQYSSGNIQQNQQNIIVFDDNTNRVLIGYQTVLQQWGLFVSQIGVDVTQATADQLVFNSNQDIFKIVDKIPTTIPSFAIGSGQVNTVLFPVPHGQSFVPICDVFVSGGLLDFSTSTILTSSFIPLPVYASAGAAGYVFNSASTTAYSLDIMYIADDTNVYIQATSNSTSSADTINPIPVTIFILQESATT